MNKYNHVTLGTQDKPLIPNAELKALIESIEQGNTDVSYWLDKWSLESYQKQVVKGLLEALKKK